MTGSRRPVVSLSVRLVAGALVWTLLLLAAGGGVLALAFRDTVEREFSHRLDAMLRAMIAATEITPAGEVAVVHPLGDPRFDQIYSGWYWQVSEPGGRQLRSRSLWDGAFDSVDGGGALHTRRLTGPGGESLLLAERDLAFPEANGPVHVIIAGDLREVSDGVRRFDLLLVSALGLLGLGMVVAILIQVRFGLRPLRALAGDLDAVRAGTRPRLSQAYPREVAPLAEAMNGVLDQDAALIERARTHVGNLAHGLKTPLAIVAAELAGLADRRVLGDQLRVMERLIAHHLGRASAVAGAGRALGIKVPVREVAESLAGALSRIFAERKLVLDIDVPWDAAYGGHREDLEEMLGNLMENACKWSAGRIMMSGGAVNGALVLAVEDDGPGMSPEQMGDAARRGSRFDELAPGWGLGLSIVSDLVAVNGGDMGFSRSRLGGLCVTLRFPAR